ncbi:hypothetical protein OJAV_G00090740 [Oryzias javanicus]|uniref:Uncharacterized protein n=1 Tax=Oryzias javanicus TaxID=123683 RepID=A0A3S2M5H0_ORYJA|nr:hypothetical protein OJAV_G00090740 [Oryzias javanicus]
MDGCGTRGYNEADVREQLHRSRRPRGMKDALQLRVQLDCASAAASGVQKGRLGEVAALPSGDSTFSSISICTEQEARKKQRPRGLKSFERSRLLMERSERCLE